MSKAIIPVGTKFSRLTVIAEAPPYKQPDGYFRPMSKCVCDCGEEIIVRNGCLPNGHTQSCGCLQKERAAKARMIHGHAKRHKSTSTYRSWAGMLTRGTNPNVPSFENYGGRGITVCERWLKFENFLADMGECPKGLSVERRDNGKGYSPENCYWGTDKQQARNKRSNHIITVHGMTGCVAELAEFFGLNYNHVYSRINRGWTPEDAFLKPKRIRPI